MTNAYGTERVQRGLLHFLIGKGLSAISGLFAILLIIRELAVSEFAAYSVLIALTDLLTAITGLGLVHALSRYVPELYAKGERNALKHFIFKASSIRTIVLIVVVGCVYLFPDWFGNSIGLGTFVSAFKVFLLVVFFRTSAHFLSIVLEASLHQGAVQAGFLVANLIRVVGILFLISQSEMTLMNVIWVEALGDLLCLIVMLDGVFRMLKGMPHNEQSNDNWLSKNTKKITRFALSGYVQQMAMLPYGNHTNRLVGGGLLSSVSMATFGFAQSIYEYAIRYMPAHLLVGMMRPVMTARYSLTRDFSVATTLCNQVIQINIMLTLFIAVFIIVGGQDLLLFVSAGKYGTNAVLLIGLLLVVLLFETQRQQLELLVHTVEKYHFIVPSNVVLSSSILLAVLLAKDWGALSFPIANIVGLLIANEWARLKLNQANLEFSHPWNQTFKVAMVFVVAVCIGFILKLTGMFWLFAMFLSTFTYIVLAYFLCKQSVIDFVHNLTGKAMDESIASQ